MRHRAPLPRQIVWEVTARCDLSCEHCYNIWTAPGEVPPKDLETGSMITILDRIAADLPRLQSLTLTGGEPLLREDLAEIAAAARTRLPRAEVNVATNGRGLTAGAARRLRSAGVSVIQTTLLAAGPELHDELTGRPGAFDSTLAAIANARAAGLLVAVFFVAMRKNVAEFPGAARLAVALGADAVVFNRFQPGGRGLSGHRERTPTPDQLAVAIAQVEELRRITTVSFGTIIPPCESPNGEGAATCPIGTRNAYPTISAEGKLRPCNHTPIVAGSLLERTLDDLLQEPCMAHPPVAEMPSRCKDCREWRTCRGGCPAAIAG